MALFSTDVLFFIKLRASKGHDEFRQALNAVDVWLSSHNAGPGRQEQAVAATRIDDLGQLAPGPQTPYRGRGTVERTA